ncbi:TIGR02391 family protein [Nocardia salmonicida]|uniref:TIGR02391 family protein n=1 Tax=Nocardia salmonicida TaxID=53431 RepID=UPI003432A327
MNVDGVDIPWAVVELEKFIELARPARKRVGESMKLRPAGGRIASLRQFEVVLPILERLYPEWASENSRTSTDEFRAQRDASRKLLVRLETRDLVAEHIGGSDRSPRITAASLHPLVWRAAQVQWSTGHRHEAVVSAAKAINSNLQTRLGRRDVSEYALILEAFTWKEAEPGKPRLRFGSVLDDQTQKSLQEGVLQFGSGCFRAIRNPLSHRPNDEFELTEQTALERLAALSLMARFIDEADLVWHPDDEPCAEEIAVVSGNAYVESSPDAEDQDD